MTKIKETIFPVRDTNSEPGLPVHKQAWRIEDFDGKLLLLLFR